MSNSPSAQALDNTFDLYRIGGGTNLQDIDASLDSPNAYAVSPDVAGVPCTAQPRDPKRMGDEFGRSTTEKTWSILYVSSQGIKINDKLVLHQPEGDVTVYADGPENTGAGRGYQCQLTATERV